jgi:hypothetical protein
VSHEIILKHHGHVRVRSRAANQENGSAQATIGTVFEVFIPDNPGFAKEASVAEDVRTSSRATA